MWKPLPSRHFKNLEGKPERESPKRTISASGGLELLQMVPGPNIGQCASEEAEPQKGVDKRQCASKNVGPQRGWIGGQGNECLRGRWATKGGGL